MTTKEQYIALFRKHGYNCFPIPSNQKIADRRYDANRTTQNQPITEAENYGVIPLLGKGNAIIDFDDKERYRNYAERMIDQGYMVIETGMGWHIPVIGLTGNIKKIELFDYKYQPTKKIIEIQSPKQYCVGVGSIILHDKLEKIIVYENKGSLKLYDVKGNDYTNFVDELCKQVKVEGKKKSSASSYQHLRDQFSKGETPKKGQSNDYFHEASKVCNTEGLSKPDAIEKIREVYDKWSTTDNFSDRPFSHILTKIDEVYEKNLTVSKGRPKKTDDNSIDRTGIAKAILETRQLYSDVETHDIFENKNGFLERINNTLKKELYEENKEIERADQDSILFKLESGANEMPETDKDLVVFKNAKFSTKKSKTIKTDKIADMGFREYDYLDKSKKNEPKKFLKVLFDNVPKYQHPRIKAGLKAIFNGRNDSRISIIYGQSGMGKSTPMDILCSVLGREYAYPVELSDFLNDRATQANVKGKRLLYFQDIPEEWKEFTKLKVLTGEHNINIRGFQKDNDVAENKLKIWASANYLPEIKESEKNAMYTRRLSLIQNTRLEPYPEDSGFAERIANDEGEKIISWILNIPDKDCKYEDAKSLKSEWEGVASPELEYLDKHYRASVDETKKPLMTIIKHCREVTGINVTLTQMTKTMKSLGYVIKNNVVMNLEEIVRDTRNQSL